MPETSATVILKGHGNWNLWFQSLQRYTKNRRTVGVFDLDSNVNPEVDLVQPEIPNPADYNPRGLRAMNQEQRQRYQEARTYYKQDVDEADRLEKALSQIRARIEDTISPDLKPILSTEPTVKDILKKLRERCSPAHFDEDNRLTEEWNLLTQQNPSRSRNFNTWIDSISRVYSEGKVVDAGFTQKPYTMALSFICAASHFDPSWALMTQHTIRNLDDHSLVKDLPYYIQKLESWHRSHSATSRKREFGLTGIDEPQFQGGGSSKRSRLHAPRSTPSSTASKEACPCGSRNTHGLDDCWALHESKRPPRWRGQRHINILEKARQDPKIDKACRESLTRVRGEKGKEKEKAPTVIRSEARDSHEESIYTSAALEVAAMASEAEHPLKNSFILDPGANAHICNSRSRCTNLREIPNLGTLLAGRGPIPLTHTGDVQVRLDSYDSDIIDHGFLTLCDTRYVPEFVTSVVSLSLLEQHRYSFHSDHLNDGPVILWKDSDEEQHVAIHLTKKYGLYIIEYNPCKDHSTSFSSSIHALAPKKPARTPPSIIPSKRPALDCKDKGWAKLQR